VSSCLCRVSLSSTLASPMLSNKNTETLLNLHTRTERGAKALTVEGATHSMLVSGHRGGALTALSAHCKQTLCLFFFKRKRGCPVAECVHVCVYSCACMYRMYA
jgi:hypothetical protein